MNSIKFKLSQLRLDEIRDERRKEREKKEWQRRFAHWNMKENEEITFDDISLRKIIIGDELHEEDIARFLVEWADKLGAIFAANDLTSSQIRNIFGEVKSIQKTGFDDKKAKSRLWLLIPKLEYAAVRANKRGLRELKDVLIQAINLVENEAQRFARFTQFFEAILAYHRAYGGS